MQSEKHGAGLLEAVSERAQLREGPEGVRKVLREIFRNQKIGTKELAIQTQLPLPVVAAVRRELEKEGVVARNGGAFLTPMGEKFAQKQLGLVYKHPLICSKCEGRSIRMPSQFAPILTLLRKHLPSRPRPLFWLDQAHGTPETALLRALFMLEKGDLEGRRIIFLGDDDFTSVAVGLLKAAREIAVVDVDHRLLNALQLVSQEEDLHIHCFEHDLRKPLPQQLHHKFDVAFTDPPYTLPGLNLFISRGITALNRRRGASLYLAFAHQPPRRMLQMQTTLNSMGLAIVEHVPRFNTYEGAEMHANTTFLARLEATEKLKPHVKGFFDGKLYTGEITQTLREYQCRCGERIEVGATQRFKTVEELKAKGCPACEKTKGFKLIQKHKLKTALAGRLKFRRFTWPDFPVILDFERQIARQSFPDAPFLDETYHRQKLKKAAKREPDNLNVALLDNEIVGWLWLRTEKDRNTKEKFGYIKSVIVKPEYRHQGIGTRLVETAKNHFRNKGIHRIDLIVSAANHEATLFFEEAGFEREHSTMRID